MKSVYRDILKHSGIYGLAQIISRLASIVLLPIYTSYLRPSDYGCIAILDLTVGILVLLIGPGMAGAVNRFHFDARDELEVDQVWWTGLTLASVLGATLLVPAWVLRGPLARLTLGPDVPRGDFYYALVLPLLWLGILIELPSTYLRARKWSGVFLVISVVRLSLNVSLNLYFLAILRLGVVAILLGNLITSAVTAAGLLALLVPNLGRFSFHRPLAWDLLRFASPLAVAGFAGLAMHNADRYLLRIYLDLDQVGLYSFAYTIAQGVNTLLLAPFNAIWATALYEIAKQADAKQIYTRLFGLFVCGFALAMLGVSLFARPLIELLAAQSYERAADLVPIICLAYVLYSLHNHFQVPALLAKRTISLLPAALAAALLNVGLNVLLIPRLGTVAAAWVSVVTFATYSLLGLWFYRRIDRYNYPFLRCGAVVAAMVVTYIGCRSLGAPTWRHPLTLAAPSVAFAAWALGIVRPVAVSWMTGFRLRAPRVVR